MLFLGLEYKIPIYTFHIHDKLKQFKTTQQTLRTKSANTILTIQYMKIFMHVIITVIISKKNNQSIKFLFLLNCLIDIHNI